MNKGIVIGVIIVLIAVSVAPSINANVSRTQVNSKLVETSVRIHRAKSIIPYTLKLREKESDEVDRIFDNLKVRLDTAETDKEIDEIYDSAVESLYELGMFPRMTLKEAKQLVNGKNKNPSVTESSINLENADENFNCQVIGWTSNTVMFDLYSLFWGLLLGGLRVLLQYQVWNLNLPYYNRKIGSITLGSAIHGIGYSTDYSPAGGWVWTNGTYGVIKWNGSFYGKIETKTIWWDPHQMWGIFAYTGIREFKGLWIKEIHKPIYLLGSAEHVKITYESPPPPW